MNENPTLTQETTDPAIDNANQYIEALAELRANTVDKQEYEKIVTEKQQLIKAMMRGETIEAPKEDVIDIDAERKLLYSGETELTNLQYAEHLLRLRQGLLDKGEEDIFWPTGSKVDVTADIDKNAKDVAAVLQHCVDFSQGSDALFTAELGRNMLDTEFPVRRR